MWKCSACGNENKDAYRFCLNCGEPRPSSEQTAPPEEKQPKKKKDSRSMVMTVLLLILALLLIAAIVAVIVNFPRLSGQAGSRRQEIVENSMISRADTPEPTEAPEKGGTSSFVFGAESATRTTPAPSVPTAAPTPEPEVTEEPLPSGVPEITVVSDGEYLIPGSDSRYITEDDLKNLTWEQCCLARNEIFARHGRMFLTKEIADYFSGKSWYRGTIPAASFSETVLNEYERANVNTISQYESAHWGGSYY